MRAIRVHFSDGNTITTEINGTEETIREYYVGNEFNHGDTDEHPADKVVTATRVEFLN